MKIGVCGTGRMGSSIAQRLMSVKHEVGVWNRSSAKAKPLTDAGAKLFASPTELVAGCGGIFLMLLNDSPPETNYFRGGRLPQSPPPPPPVSYPTTLPSHPP